MSDYGHIARELHRVRRAWRRTAVLTGLALVAVEMVGLFSVAILLDVLFQLGVAGRVGLLAVLVGAVAWLLARHALAPLLRRLPDAQVALFVEEHCPGFEGALIAAVEFGVTETADPDQRALVAAILAEAEARARRIEARKAVDFSRLRKYALTGLGVLGAYALLGTAFPAGMARHATRLVKPWQPEAPTALQAPAVAAKPPLEIVLSCGDTDLLRGAPFALDAVLSREPDGPVSFHFRSLAESAQDDGRWLLLAMQPAEKLHAYALQVPDVNEPLAFFVAAENERTQTYQINVYDPLTVADLEITVRYPAYLSLPDRVLLTPSGDVTVPEGASLFVKVSANRPLVAGGGIVLEDGSECPLVVCADAPSAAIATLAPTASTTYRYRVADDRHQRLESPVPGRLTVAPDQAPSVTLRQPQQAITPLPIDEVTFAVEAGDDFGVAAIELVYRRAQVPQPVRVPFALAATPAAAGAGGSVAATLVLALESLQPPVQPKEVFTYHVEVTDRKGQTAVTPIGIMPVRYLDVWAVEEAGTGAPPEPLSAKPELPELLNAAWQIHGQRARLPAADLARQAEALAQAMIDPATAAVWVFAEAKPGERPTPDTLEQYRRINALAAEGRQELVRHDTGAAVEKLREAVVIMVALGLVENLEQLLASTAANPGSAAAEFQPQAQALALLEAQAPAVKPPDAGTVREVDRAAEVRRQSLEVEELEAAQRKVVERLGDLARPTAADAAKAPRERQLLAAEQGRLADQTEEAAQALRRAAAAPDTRLEDAADRLREAAHRMRAAAQELTQARPERATQPAREAREQLTGVREQLTGLAQDQLVQALNQAEQQADRLFRRQDDLRRRSEPLAREMGETPSARAQRDARILAADQARSQPDLARLEGVLAALGTAASANAVPRDAARYVQGAVRDLRRGRVADKMTNAAVELAALRPANAVPEQQDATRSLERVLENVRAANDSLISDEGAELRRARREAQQLDAALGRLAPAAAAAVDRSTRPPQARPPAAAPATPAEREALTTEAGVTLDQLQRHSQARKLLSEPVQRQLETYAAERTLPHVVPQDDAKAVALLETVRRAHVELETAYQSHLAARRLFAAQREECPPQYRHLVNRYFEALSTTPP